MSNYVQKKFQQRKEKKTCIVPMYEYLYRLGSTTQNRKSNDRNQKWIAVNVQNNLKFFNWKLQNVPCVW